MTIKPLLYRSTLADLVDFLDINHAGVRIARVPAPKGPALWQVRAFRINAVGVEFVTSVVARPLITDAINDAVESLPEKAL